MKDLYPRQQAGLVLTIIAFILACVTASVMFVFLTGMGVGMLSGNTRTRRYSFRPTHQKEPK